MENREEKYVSFSRLSRWLRCPRSYQKHYLEGREDTPGAPALFGKAVHRVLELEAQAGQLVRLDALLSRWVEVAAEQGITAPEDHQAAEQLFRRFARRQHTWPAELLGVEVEFAYRLNGHTIKGVIDRVERTPDGLLVTDYKTSWKVYTADEAKSSLQAAVYLLAAEELWPGEPVTVQFWFLRHDIILRHAKSPEDVELARRWVRTLVWALERAESYPPKLNPYCQYCSYRNDCPAYQQAHELPPHLKEPSNVAEALEIRNDLANRIKILEGRKKKLDSDLKKTALAAGGELATEQGAVKLQVTRRKKWSPQKVREIFERYTGSSDALEQLLEVNRRALEEYLAGMKNRMDAIRWRMFQAEIEAAAEVEETTRLKILPPRVV